jgi:hypothetical protein
MAAPVDAVAAGMRRDPAVNVENVELPALVPRISRGEYLDDLLRRPAAAPLSVAISVSTTSRGELPSRSSFTPSMP